MIPERVEEITCATTKRPKVFETPVGRFSYQTVPKTVFGIGVTLEAADGGHYFLASPEKALCDLVAQVKPFTELDEVEEYLLEDLRLDEATLGQLSVAAMNEIANLYRRTPVRLLARWTATYNRISL